MRVIDPGHRYEFNVLDNELHAEALDGKVHEEILQFVKRKGPKYPGNKSAYPGTTMQEVLRALIDRIMYVDQQESYQSNKIAINNFRSAIYYLELRAAERHGRLPEFLSSVKQLHIETYPVCEKCGHIMCHGKCHAEEG